MLDWLKNLGGKKPWQNRAGLDDKSVLLLAEDFNTLEKLDENLPTAAMCYLLDGEGDTVLARLSSTQGVSEALGLVRLLTNPRENDGSVRVKFFDQVRCADATFFVRLGKVYEAAVRSPVSKTGRFPHMFGVLQQPAFGDPNLKWLDMLLIQATRLTLNTYPQKCRPCPALNAEVIEAVLQSEGYAPNLLIRTAFQPQNISRFGAGPLEKVFRTLQGLSESAVRHKHTLAEILSHPDFKQRVYALDMMKECKVPLEPFVGKLLDLCLESSKQVREQARIVMVEISDAVRPLIEEKIRNGENEERVQAVQLLWHWEREKARAFLEERLTQEKNKKVIQTIQDLIAPPPIERGDGAVNDLLQLQPLPPIPHTLPLGPETKLAWQECLKKVNDGIARVINTNSPQHKYVNRNLKTIPQNAIDQAFEALASGLPGAILGGLIYSSHNKEMLDPLRAFWERPELQAVHLVRFLLEAGALSPEAPQDRQLLAYGFWSETLFVAYRRTHPETGLRELAAAFTAVGLDAGRIGRSILGQYYVRSAIFGMPKAQIWPYWMEHLDLLEEAFTPGSSGSDFMARYYQKNARTNAFGVLALFPTCPPRLIPLLWNLALGPKSERPDAQRCLESASDKLERLVVGLGAGSAETRFAAAEWLGRLGNKGAIEPLLAAVKREKNEAAKGAMMLALELLGVPVDQFLDRAALLKEAEKGLSKELPEDLKWFPFASLPVVHWQDTGEPVHSEILRWWIVQGFKLKTPEPGPLLRRYCASIKPSEREALGQFVLEAWMAEDTSPISRAEAEQRARTQAQQMVHYGQYLYQQAQKNPQTQAPPPLTVDQYIAQYLPGFLKQPKGSATASKGILSVAGACVGAAAALVINRYLKEWYGQRAAQCKALIQMLAWVEHRTATQLILAVGSRFRTKSIQEEANQQAQALAERKGWTVAELADRTIPSAGMDENGVLTIDYGPRQFTAKLTEDMDFALTDAEGKAIKALPDPRKDDDEAKATEAKKMFSAAKKELKSVVTMQRDRFYEAMCTQRTWNFEDWSLYLNQHPIVRHHCQRLVWSVVQNNKAVRLFRPLADGSLTDAADNPVELKGDDQIRIAHECQVTPEDSKLWRQHLKDYNIESLFEQFGRPNFDLSDERKTETELSDFQGHVLEAFKLRGRANKLGYTRGQAQDGGWFFDYHKRFPTLGIEATIEFTGNGLPEENRTVALTKLRFDRIAEAGGQNENLLLSEVPSVLLSECWNDIRTIAAEGAGFDAEWDKKTQP